MADEPPPTPPASQEKPAPPSGPPPPDAEPSTAETPKVETPKAEPPSAAEPQDVSAAEAAAATEPKDTEDDSLPEGWVAKVDPSSGKTYYVYTPNGGSQWHKPGTEPAQASPQPAQASPQPAGGPTGAAVAYSATEAMRNLVTELEDIYEKAAKEELMDNGGGEHGADKAKDALEAAQAMLESWEVRCKGL